MTDRHPAMDLLGRYRAVWRAAWAIRHELAGPARLADELAFLPAALSLQQTPPHPAPRRAAVLICVLFLLALAWSWFGHVDVVAVAPGRIVVAEGTKLIQPLEAGVVRRIHVRDGDRVQAGQLLVELDSTAAVSDHRSVGAQLQAARAEAWRASALLSSIDSGAARLLAEKAPFTEDPSLADQALAQAQAEWSDLGARLARHDAEAQRRQAELATLQSAMAKLEALLPLARQREADYAALTAQGFVAGHALQDRARERVEIERDLATQRQRVHEVEAGRVEAAKAREATLAEGRRTLSERLARAQADIAQLTLQGEKTALKERLTRLTAPVTGTVQQLAVHSPGGVVTPAQTLMVVVPDGASVLAEVTIDNKDIGFVRAGQAAEVKLETFNFTRYGTLPAHVRHVSADAVLDEKRGAVFVATLQFERTALEVDGAAVPLAAGMSLGVEIKTGRRRVIAFALDPVFRASSVALRER